MIRTLAQLFSTVTGDETLLSWIQQRDEAGRRQQAIGRVCHDAMLRAGIDPVDTPVVISDIGLLAYRRPDRPKLVRTAPVMADSRYLRPFAEITVRERTRPTMRLAIYDDQQRLRFSDDFQRLRRGKARLVTKTWLPVENLDLVAGKWGVALIVEDTIFGYHPFSWEELVDNEVLNQLRTDGEINDELRYALKQGKFSKMTLDELLVYQEE